MAREKPARYGGTRWWGMLLLLGAASIPLVLVSSGDWNGGDREEAGRDDTTGVSDLTVLSSYGARTDSPDVVAVRGHQAGSDAPGQVSRASLRIRLVDGEDSSPLPAIPLALVPLGLPGGEARAKRSLTDHSGEWLLEDLFAGSYRVLVHGNGQTETVKLLDGESRVTEISLAPSTTVTGVVVDETGRPVAAADVWLSCFASWQEGLIVAHTDAAGGFRVPGVGSRRFIAAVADGHASSMLHPVEGSPGAIWDIRLEVLSDAGRVTGTVRDATGLPVAGVDIEAGWTKEEERPIGEDGNRVVAPTFSRTVTDERGEYVLSSLRPGARRLVYSAPGHVTVDRLIDLDPSFDPVVDVTMEKAFIVECHLVSGSGDPVEGARIEARGGGAALDRVRTDASGFARLTGLPPGEVEVNLQHDGEGMAHDVLRGRPGEILVWRPRLRPGAIFSGVVTCSLTDEPLAECVVQVVRLSPYRARQTVTDGRGEFHIPNCPDVPHALEVSLPGMDVPARIIPAARPGHHRISVSWRDRADLHVTGRIVRGDGGSLAGIRVQVGHPMSSSVREVGVNPATGEFRVGPLARSEFLHAEVVGQDIVRRSLGLLEFGEGSELDVGTVDVAASGTLLVRLSSPCLGVTADTWCRLLGENGVQESVLQIERAHCGGLLARSERVATGDYTLEVGGAGTASLRRTIRILPDVETRVDLELGPGCLQRLVFDPGPGRSPSLVHLTIVAADGRGIRDCPVFRLPGAAELDYSLSLGVGHYLVTVRAPDGAEAEETITVRDLEDVGREHRFVLR